MLTASQKRLPGGSLRLPLIVLTACLALAVVCAEVFVFTNLEHDCTGAHCSVCLQIEIAQNLLEGLGRIGISVPAIGLFAYTKKMIKSLRAFYVRAPSPVLLKVKSLS